MKTDGRRREAKYKYISIFITRMIRLLLLLLLLLPAAHNTHTKTQKNTKYYV